MELQPVLCGQKSGGIVNSKGEIKMRIIRKVSVFLCLAFLFCLNLSGMNPEDAFKWSYMMNESEFAVTVSVEKGFHLYENTTKVTLFSNGTELKPVRKPASISYEDKVFGKNDVYRGKSDFQWVFAIGGQKFPLELKLAWQGCSEATKDSEPVCFFPESREYTFSKLELTKSPLPLLKEKKAEIVQDAADSNSEFPGFEIVRTESGYMASDMFLPFLKGEKSEMFLNFADKSFLLILILTFIGGIALNLTPCVLPMIPINLAIIGADAGKEHRLASMSKGLVYGLGIALAYGALGLFVVLTGSSFGVIDSTWWFNAVVAVIFVLLGLSLFDVFMIDFSRYGSNFKMPSGAKIIGIFVMGVIAALLAGACVAPVVVAALLQASKMYNSGEHIGLILPFVLGIGMGLPWPIAAAGFSIMPKPGVWMKYVKYVFGVVIIIVGLYYAYTGVVIYTSLAESHKNIEKSMDSLFSALRESGKTKRLVFIDFRAEWCKNCKAMEKTTFKDPAVRNELKNFIVVEFDATDMANADIRKVLKKFDVSGLPTYVIARGK